MFDVSVKPQHICSCSKADWCYGQLHNCWRMPSVARSIRCTHLQALLDDVQQDEETEEVHATHSNGPQQIRPEEAMLGTHSVVVPTCKHHTCHYSLLQQTHMHVSVAFGDMQIMFVYEEC